MRSAKNTPSVANPSKREYWGSHYQVESGDVLLFRGKGLIPIAGRSIYSHAAIAGWWRDHLMCLELREWKGGRAVTLWSQCRKYPDGIDVFRPSVSLHKRDKAMIAMIGKCGHPYAYLGIFFTSLLHLCGIRLLVKPNLSDRDTPPRYKPEYCSQAVASAYQRAGLDLVPNLSNSETEPGDLGRSSFLKYQFTLVPKAAA